MFCPTPNNRTKHIKGSKGRLFIRTQTRSLQILGVIPLSSYKTTLKQQLNGQAQPKRISHFDSCLIFHRF